MMNYRITILLILLTVIKINSYSQVDSTKFNFIKSVSSDLSSYYVFKDIGKKMSDSIQLKFRIGGYDSTLNIDEFAFEVTKDLRKISNDRHISFWAPDQKTCNEIVRQRIKFKKNIAHKLFPQLITKRYKRAYSRDSYEYGEIKILPGNIGYIEIFQLSSMSIEKRKNKNRIKFSNVNKFLSKTDAIIIDFRNNQGGSVGQASYFCSFFISSIDTSSYFSTIKKRDGGHESLYTKDTLIYSTTKCLLEKNKKSLKFNNKKIYLLTSNRTFSAAELIAYKLQKYSNTIIVGEKTLGGGNGYNGAYYNDCYSGIIPNSYIYDESNQNYSIEGIGIKPNIETSEDSAMVIAYNNINLNIEKQKTVYLDRKSNKKRKIKSIKINNKDYTGSYGKYIVIEKEEKLYLIKDDIIQVKLTPTGKDNFISNQFNRINFNRDSNSNIVGIQVEFKNGFNEKFRKK